MHAFTDCKRLNQPPRSSWALRLDGLGVSTLYSVVAYYKAHAPFYARRLCRLPKRLVSSPLGVSGGGGGGGGDGGCELSRSAGSTAVN